MRGAAGVRHRQVVPLVALPPGAQRRLNAHRAAAALTVPQAQVRGSPMGSFKAPCRCVAALWAPFRRLAGARQPYGLL